MKRSGMPPRTNPMRRNGRLPQRKKGLSAQSPKQRAQRIKVKAAQDEALTRDGHRCQVTRINADPVSPEGAALAHALLQGCSGPIDPHHKATQGARRDLADDVDNIVALCRVHHDWVHNNIGRARLLGLYGPPEPDCEDTQR